MLVFVIALALTPMSWALLATARYAGAHFAVVALLGLSLIPISAKIGRYIAAPLVDHLFGIPQRMGA